MHYELSNNLTILYFKKAGREGNLLLDVPISIGFLFSFARSNMDVPRIKNKRKEIDLWRSKAGRTLGVS
jgi:hypothetical protein